MPTYEYACTACGHRLDAVQKFSDDPLTVCPECGGALRKVYGAVGIVLKGSGFYKNDSRTGGSGSPSKKDSDSKETSSGDSKTETSTKSEPATSSSSDSSSTPAKDSKPAAASTT
ncbi:MAG TPA: FmdB family zinc ribbon protein [Acidimicrobiales bacterium]|jgi:putative FmdB family regulatory protein